MLYLLDLIVRCLCAFKYTAADRYDCLCDVINFTVLAVTALFLFTIAEVIKLFGYVFVIYGSGIAPVIFKKNYLTISSTYTRLKNNLVRMKG